MCSAPCAAAIGGSGRRGGAAFHVARLLGYAAAGAVAAASVSALAAWGQISPALRPLWVLVQSAALALGLWLLVTARQPAWMSKLGRVPNTGAAQGWQPVSGPGPGTGTGRAALAGGLWFAWPCGLLHSALLVAAMANSAGSGAAVMAGFALASAPGLVLGPWALQRLLRGADAAARERLAARAAGGLLVGASAWALGHGVWHQVAVFCGLA